MNDKKDAYCPHCGALMDGYARRPVGKWSTVCGKCGAMGPIADSMEAAYAAAMKQVEPENRVLTLEEAVSDEYPYVLLEARLCKETFAADCVIAPSMKNADISLFYGHLVQPLEMYGVTWRCWLRKPTDEERAAVKWEDGTDAR